MLLKDLTGQRFGRLRVVKRGEDYVSPNGRHRIMWECLCDCGKEALVCGDSLKKGATRSCGCYKNQLLSERQGGHRQTDTKLYGVWCAIKRRCYNPHVFAYEDYGGRGIYMCEEWKRDFQAFADWAAQSGYTPSLSIDRIDNDGPYSPENCRWTTAKEQANNRRSNLWLTYNGETHTATQWGEILGIDPKKVMWRSHAGWPVERILST